MNKRRKWLVILAVISMLFTNTANVNAAQKTPPAPTLSCSPATPTNGSVTVTINYPKNAVVKQYKLGTTGSWINYSAPVIVTSNTYVYAQYQNNSGFWSPSGSLSITNIDKTPPSVPVLSQSALNTTNGAVSVSISYSTDANIKQYKIGDTGIWTNYFMPVTITTNTTVYARAQDLAGNWSSEASLVISGIGIAPSAAPTFSVSTTSITDHPVILTISYNTDSVLKQYRIGTNGIWTDYTTPVVLNSNNTVYARSFDTTGNWSIEASCEVANIRKTVLGYTVKYYSTDMTSYNSMSANTGILNEIATATYAVDGYGNLSGTAPTDQINFANSNGIRPKLMVSNNFDANIAKQMLESSANRQNLKNSILNLIKTYNYSGVDIDIENIPAADRDYFTTLMREIYSTLNPLGYGVSVAVQAKTYDSPNAAWNYAFDYKALAQYSDYLMIMAYDEHYPGSTPGAIASINWVTSVVDYALTVVPKEKIILGMAAYGYDWVGTTTKAYSINSCYSLANQYGAAIKFDDITKSKYFTYSVNGTSHTVWFEDGETIAYKLDLVNSRDLKGVGIWRLGLENSNYWSTIKTKLNK